MKSLGDIYRDGECEPEKNKWYHMVWFYLAFIAIFIILLPAGIWRRVVYRDK